MRLAFSITEIPFSGTILVINLKRYTIRHEMQACSIESTLGTKVSRRVRRVHVSDSNDPSDGASICHHVGKSLCEFHR